MPLRLEIVSDHPDLKPDLRVREFKACGGTIGRSPDNDWVLPDDRRYVSSRHAVLDFQAGAYYLVDTSRNGVYVNGSDLPVGKGHPQRIFDGDRLRIGEYQIAVAITGNEDNIPDDGMRDSIVRAQLVREEDPSVEMLLVDESKLLQDSSFQRHLTPALEATGGVLAPVRPAAVATAKRPPASTPATSRTPPTLGNVARAPSRPAASPQAKAGGAATPDALLQLLEGAGLKPEAMTGTTPAEVVQLAGRLLRVTVAGLMDMLKERNQILDSFRIPQASRKQGQDNPLRFSPNVEEALRYLLAGRGDSDYLEAEDALREALKELRLHEQTMHRAMLQAVRDYAEHFDPDELKNRFDRGLKRSGILSGTNRLKYWELYEENYAALTHREEGGPPQLFAEEFARAYQAELEDSRTSRR